MNDTTKQILIAVAASAAAAATAAIVSNYLTKKAIAAGSTPLPHDATPTFNPPPPAGGTQPGGNQVNLPANPMSQALPNIDTLLFNPNIPVQKQGGYQGGSQFPDAGT
jgi:hypothetical protein